LLRALQFRKLSQGVTDPLAETNLNCEPAPVAGATAIGAVIITVLFVLYPFLVYLGLAYARLSAVAILVILISIGRLVFYRRSAVFLRSSAVWISAGGILLAGTMLLRGSSDAMLFYPAFVNIVLLTVFVYSLIFPPTVITRLARRHDPGLPDSGIRYTRNVTLVWSAFFLLNGLVALYTAVWTTIEIWTIYNGFVAYVLMGALMAGEWLLRPKFTATEAHLS